MKELRLLFPPGLGEEGRNSPGKGKSPGSALLSVATGTTLGSGGWWFIRSRPPELGVAKGGRLRGGRPFPPANACLQAHREHVTLALEHWRERVHCVHHAEVDVERHAGRRPGHRPRRVEVAEQRRLSGTSVVGRDRRRRQREPFAEREPRG